MEFTTSMWGAEFVAHSHLPVQHLIRQVEMRRTLRIRRGARPDWVTRFIEQVADSFEPTEGVGRVGFVCHPGDDGWTVTMYLGRNEIVGGSEDGAARPMSFEFNLQAVSACFSEVLGMRWLVRPEPNAGNEELPGSQLSISGRVNNSPLQLIVTATPPHAVGPGLRQYPDGTFNPA